GGYERLTFEGRFHRYTDVEVLPKPAQRPHPPAWVAATSPSAVEWAAERGHSILMDPHSPHGEIARKKRLYLDGLAKHGHDAEGRDLPVGRLVVVAESDAKAEEVARRGARWTAGAYLPKEALGQFRPGDAPVDAVDHYLNEVVIHGSPEKVVDELLRLEEEIPLGYLLLSPLSEQTFGLFTDHVLPRVA
ncbi:MAG: LLM class flavin-dependent oxidoreductase, partial [Actinomycetota bacterium]|nr:LLM class flavin-dependent oxidoreductase [Actinomycetota bacterium]